MSIRPLSKLSALSTFVWLIAATDAKAAPPTGAPSAPVTHAAPDEPMAEFRERFKEGMDRYRAGALTEAIGYWDPIYRQLGEQKGYRLAYNLGVAYAEQGDATRAAERLQTFLGQVEARRTHGEALETIVQKEEADAEARLTVLTALKGRLRIDAGSPPRAVQIDASEPRLAGFVAWVNPGEHSVTFSPGTPDTQALRVTVRAGETADVTAPPAPPSPAVVAPATPVRYPFSPTLIAVSGGLALVATVAAVKLDDDTLAQYHALLNQHPDGIPSNDPGRQSFESQRTMAYGAVGAAIGLGALTAGLVAWYFLGTSSNREIGFTPTGVAGTF